MRVITTLLLLTFCTVCYISHAAGFPPRPHFPQHMFIDNGVVECAYGNGAPPCASEARGVLLGWWAFDDAGNFAHYREDAVLDNSTIVFNRELATPEGTREFFLVDNSAALQCVQFQAPTNFSRFCLASAQYEGITLVKGVKVYTFQAAWMMLGKEVPVTVWVAVETEKIFGWSWGPVSYYYYSYADLPSFNPWPFVPFAGVTCVPATVGLANEK